MNSSPFQEEMQHIVSAASKRRLSQSTLYPSAQDLEVAEPEVMTPSNPLHHHAADDETKTMRRLSASSSLYPSTRDLEGADVATRNPLSFEWAKAMEFAQHTLLGEEVDALEEAFMYVPC